MFKRLFGSAKRANRAIADALYAEIVAAARQPRYFADLDVPDTPLGRYEMLSLHMFLFLHRLKNETGSAAELARDVTDMFFKDIDHSLRELGVGDIGIPKRMKKLAKMFYGRASSYGRALDEGDLRALAEALARNIRPGDVDWPHADGLAEQVFRLYDAMSRNDIGEILAGRVSFGAHADGGA